METSRLNEKYLQIINSHEKQTLKDILRLKEKLKIEADMFDNIPVDFLVVPKLFNAEIIRHFGQIVETAYGILIKVIGRYLTDERYRGLFKFDPLLEQMILSPCGYESLLPIARIDLFYNEETGDFKFCEFNTDGTSGMAEETDIIKGLSETFAFNKFAKDLDVVYFELYKSWVKEFTAVYNTYEKKNNHPVIAIVDFLESGVSNEFEIFRREFESFGYQCMIADIRQLEFKDRYFYYNGKKINAIYRRAVTGEILAKKDTCPEFINGAMNTDTCIIGHFRTQVAHVKSLFAILNMDETYAFLTEEEIEFVKAHVPFTTSLCSGNYNYNKILHNKNNWIIKPSDMYASKNVYAGIDVTEAEWEKALSSGIKNDYLLQEFVAPYQTENCYFDKNNQLVIDSFGNITGLYIYNGKFAGVFSRAGKHGVISAQHDGFSLGSMYVR